MVEPRILLAGGGHSHALALLRWARQRWRGAQVTLVSDTTRAPYSGMLPGAVAGQYQFEDLEIDLERLCAAAGAALVPAQATGIDRRQRRLLLAGGASLPYDLLSLNLGATPRLAARGADQHATPVKPIAGFRGRWEALLQRALGRPGRLSVAVVGAGAAGVELALALQARLAREQVRVELFGAAARLLPSRPAGVGRRLAALLAQRGIGLHLGQPVVAVDAGGVVTADGGRHPADEVLWVTAAAAAPWLAGTGLALDTGGFVRVHRTLQSITDARVFAAGDVAAVDGWALEKAGVVAVRQAPVLADNLRRAAAGQALRPWKPQRDWLAILGTGDGRAIATRGPLHAEGAWAWRWKQGIDRRFMRQFQQVLQ